MEAKDIPKECLENSRFSMVLKATLETEIKKKQQKLKNVHDQIETVKKSVELKYNERKTAKQLLEIGREKSKILEPTLRVLSASCEEKRFELVFLKEDLDSDSLKFRDEQLKYQRIIENYKSTWETHKKEYEKLDDAIRRKKAKMALEKAKIELMILEFKRNQLITMLKQREAINNIRLIALIKEISQLVLDRWKQQSYQDTLITDIGNLRKQYEETCKNHRETQQRIKEEAEAKALARRLMPAPKIDSSMLRSVYSATPRSTVRKICRENSMGPDTISVCSLILDQLYSGNEKVINKINNEETKGDAELLQELSCCECSPNTDAEENSLHEDNVNTLENECRQLSIEEESICEENNINMEDSNNIKAQQLICEAIIETPRLPEYKIAYLSPVSQLKKKPSESIDSIHDISVEPEKKRSKLTQSSLGNLLTSSNLENEKNNTQNSLKKSLPSIKKIEIINEPIKMQIKPPMAEVPPTPNFCPNRHYTTSCTGSEDHLSIMDDGIDTTWQNFSSPNRAGSALSFMSNTSMIKNMMYDTPVMPTYSSEIISNQLITKDINSVLPTSQANNPANFFSCFTNVKPSTQNFF